MGYNASKRNVLLPGDVELNPGPDNIENIHFSNPDFVLKQRMLRYGLRPLDVGGGGNCCFKSVSHQLYGNSHSHANPERFIGIVVGTPWSQFLHDMSVQGTWADHLVIQAVADAMNLKLSHYRIRSRF